MGVGRKQSVSFRFARDTVDRLRRRADQAASTQASLAERYIDEGMRMDEHPGIYFRDAGSGRRPSLLGTHLDVAEIIETLRQNSDSIDETADYLDLSPAQVESAVRYYAAFAEEIDAWIEESRAVAERERELWRRRERALGR